MWMVDGMLPKQNVPSVKRYCVNGRYYVYAPTVEVARLRFADSKLAEIKTIVSDEGPWDTSLVENWWPARKRTS
jgi:hypothetical protein